MKKYISIILILIVVGTSLCQSITDTMKSDKKSKLESGNSSRSNNLPLQLLNPIPKKVFGPTDLQLNLHIYSKAFANDYKTKPSFSADDLASGLSDEELWAFNNNKLRLQKSLTDFYGEDLINIEKLLESLGLTKEQIIALAAMLKFIFAQGMYAAPI